jgi:hypothetical protein
MFSIGTLIVRVTCSGDRCVFERVDGVRDEWTVGSIDVHGADQTVMFKGTFEAVYSLTPASCRIPEGVKYSESERVSGYVECVPSE